MLVIVALLSLGQIHSFMNIHGTVLQRMNSALPVVTVSSYSERTKLLRDILNSKEITIMPCCYDGLSARIVEQSGFNLTFMTGFGVSAVHGLPDTGLISADEMVMSANLICSSLKRIPCIGDGDTGYGNVCNVRRTIQSYMKAGLSGIMIEDQVSPKRCGHTRGKQVVDRTEAYDRIRAAVEARREMKDQDIVILARTDARIISLDEAIERCRMFMELGADWTFLEAPRSEAEMIEYCSRVKGPKLANMLEGGDTPIITPARLQEIGYSVAAYPLTLLSASVRAMSKSLELLKQQKSTDEMILPFRDLQTIVGFDEYNRFLDQY